METTSLDSSMKSPRVTLRQFLGRRAESDDGIARLSAESQAALRQFSLERLMGYGLAYADVIELRARVLEGEKWEAAATALAEIALEQANAASMIAAQTTRILYLRRASALLRMSQMMMLIDTPERRKVFAHAGTIYGEAATLQSDRQRILIETDSRPLVGWLIPARGGAVASAIVIGGVEGWAMDFDSIGEALAVRGIDALMLDGPGQGESRFNHDHYLNVHWSDAYRSAIDFLENRTPGRRIGFIGNSIGGSFAMAMASIDKRISACCCNGGVIKPTLAQGKTTFFAKMVATCGTQNEEEAVAVWQTVDPVAPSNRGYPLLIVHGGKDPMLPMVASEMLLAAAPTEDKEMVVFSDGDHCIYNHRDDRDALIADWVRSRLAQEMSCES
jgi:alpha-beta hydrolase superfamily lysophospholipase